VIGNLELVAKVLVNAKNRPSGSGTQVSDFATTQASGLSGATSHDGSSDSE